jgi:hypothetical protein
MIQPQPFLKTVAQAYVENEYEYLSTYCFVTPNKRSGVFLSKYFCDLFSAENIPALLPAIVPIAEFVETFTDKVEASKIEQLFILYSVYSDILNAQMSAEEKAKGHNLVNFNTFQYWGDVLLNDFSDVDKYLVDPEQIFKNVKDLKEIKADFLTDEQIEVIKRYWNTNMEPGYERDFWEHIVKPGDKNAKPGRNATGFIKLWQVMLDIYNSFRQKLDELGLTYSGKIYRDACEKLQHISTEELLYRRYIFVGFNVLSESEKKIFSMLKALGIADFYWDFASPMFEKKSNTACRFLPKLIKEFPSRYANTTTPVNYFPEVNVISMPTSSGQTKAVLPILQKLHPDAFLKPNDDAPLSNEQIRRRQADQERLFDTAIVLPDESLSLSMMRSLSDSVDTVNVTMGYSLRQTPVAQLLRTIISLQLRARKLKYDNTFYYEDVLAVLANPLIRSNHEAECNEIAHIIQTYRLFNIERDKLSEFKALQPIFSVVSNVNDSNAVINYLDNLLCWIEDLLISGTQVPKPDTQLDDDVDENISQVVSLEVGFVRGYRTAISELRRLANRYLGPYTGVYLEDKTVFHLVERLAGSMSVQFEGLPLKGLQVMGVLETRSLDFDNLFILSMNERIFPRKHYTRSMIPHAIRAGYGMATIEHQESIYAYYFYRLITRAKNVYLLYDGRTSGVRSGDASRYINQLRYIIDTKRFGNKFHFSTGNYPIEPIKNTKIIIPKSSQALEQLAKFKACTNPGAACSNCDKRRDGGCRHFSASSLNTYINCPLQFYMQYILGFYPVDEPKEYMDEGTYGSIIHEVLERLYMQEKGDRDELPITSQIVDSWLKSKFKLDDTLTRVIKKLYLKRKEDDPKPLEGDAMVFHNVMLRSLRMILRRDCQLNGKSFVSGEIPDYVRLTTNRHCVNLSFRIDRIDHVFVNEPSGLDKSMQHIRLIDYKTGSDKTRCPNLASLFDSSRQDRQKAIFQLLLYSLAYKQRHDHKGPIQPYLYKFMTVAQEPFEPLIIDSKKVECFSDYEDDFVALFDKLLDEIFDENVPFKANPSDHSCKYCSFHKICSL